MARVDYSADSVHVLKAKEAAKCRGEWSAKSRGERISQPQLKSPFDCESLFLELGCMSQRSSLFQSCAPLLKLADQKMCTLTQSIANVPVAQLFGPVYPAEKLMFKAFPSARAVTHDKIPCP